MQVMDLLYVSYCGGGGGGREGGGGEVGMPIYYLHEGFRAC